MGTLLFIKSFALHRQCLNRTNTISFPSYTRFKQILLTFPRCWPINEIKNGTWNSMYTHRTLHSSAAGHVCMPQNGTPQLQSWLCHFQLWDLGHVRHHPKDFVLWSHFTLTSNLGPRYYYHPKLGQEETQVEKAEKFTEAQLTWDHTEAQTLVFLLKIPRSHVTPCPGLNHLKKTSPRFPYGYMLETLFCILCSPIQDSRINNRINICPVYLKAPGFMWAPIPPTLPVAK